MKALQSISILFTCLLFINCTSRMNKPTVENEHGETNSKTTNKVVKKQEDDDGFQSKKIKDFDGVIVSNSDVQVQELFLTSNSESGVLVSSIKTFDKASFENEKLGTSHTPMVVLLNEQFTNLVQDKVPSFTGLIAIPKNSDVDILTKLEPTLNLVSKQNTRIKPRTETELELEILREWVRRPPPKRESMDTIKKDFEIDLAIKNQKIDFKRINETFIRQLESRLIENQYKPFVKGGKVKQIKIIRKLLNDMEVKIRKDKELKVVYPILFASTAAATITAIVLGLNKNEKLVKVVENLGDTSVAKSLGYVKFNEPTEVVILGEYDSETDSYEKLGTMVLDGIVGSLVQE